jgi:maleate isomerase
MFERAIKLGILVPAVNDAIEPEMWKMTPEGVTVHAERLMFSMPEVTEEVFLGFLEEIVQDASRAAKAIAKVHPNVINFGCTSGSFYKGIEHDKEIIKMIEGETGIPAVTTSTSVVEGLKELGLKKVCLISPYTESINDRAKEFLCDNGIEIIAMKGLGLAPIDFQYVKQSSNLAYEMAKSIYTEKCDGLFCSCTMFKVVGIIEKFEKDFDKPMVTANQASMWLMLKKAKYGKPVSGFGELLRHL